MCSWVSSRSLPIEVSILDSSPPKAAANQGLRGNLPGERVNGFDFDNVKEPKKDDQENWAESPFQARPAHNGHSLWLQKGTGGRKETVGPACVCPAECPYFPTMMDSGEQCSEIGCLSNSIIESGQPTNDISCSQDNCAEALFMAKVNADFSSPFCVGASSGTGNSLETFVVDSLPDDVQKPSAAAGCSCLQSLFPTAWLLSEAPEIHKDWSQAGETTMANMGIPIQEASDYDQPQDVDGGGQEPESEKSTHRLLDLDCMSNNLLFGDYALPQDCVPDSVTGLNYCKPVQSAGADDVGTFPMGFSQEQLLAFAVQANQASGRTQEGLAGTVCGNVNVESREDDGSFISESEYFSSTTDCPGPVKTQMFLPVSLPMERLLQHTEECLHPRQPISLSSSRSSNHSKTPLSPIEGLSLAHPNSDPKSLGCDGNEPEFKSGNNLPQVPGPKSVNEAHKLQEKSPFLKLRLLSTRQGRTEKPTISGKACNAADSGQDFVQSLRSNRKGLLDHLRRLISHRTGTAMPRASTGRVSVQSQPWYSPLSTRVDVEHHLSGKAEGSFVIRNSSNSRGFSLAVVSSRNEVVHLIIQNTGGHLQVGGDNVSFDSLDGLVRYYRRHRLHVFGSLDTTLKLPSGLSSTGRAKSESPAPQP